MLKALWAAKGGFLEEETIHRNLRMSKNSLSVGWKQ